MNRFKIKTARSVYFKAIITCCVICHMALHAQTGAPVVVFPNGGQTLTIGSTVTITWSGTALGTVVGIDYTINNWTTTTWLTTSFSNPTANSYTWVVPNTPGTQCKIGIFDTSFQGDISDNFFTIAAPAVAPTANFSYSGNACVNVPVIFSDLSGDAPTGWSWSVAPTALIQTPASQNPTITFPGQGSYTVSLVASNSIGAGAPLSKTITISNSPAVIASASGTLICKGQSTTLSATGANTYSWSNGTAGNTMVVTPTANITYTVTGTNNANCSSKTLVAITVNPCAGLEEVANEDEPGWQIYPNPGRSIISIQSIAHHPLKNSSIIIMNSIGQEVKQQNMGATGYDIDVSGLLPGIYNLHLVIDGKSLGVKKMVKSE